MRKATLILIALLSLAFATSASAQTYIPKKGHACKSGYIRKEVTKRELKGKRPHRRVIRVKVRECVSVAKTKPGATPVGITTPTVAPTITAHLDPTFTQDPDDPLDVTYNYSASAQSQLTDTQPVQVNLPAGILNLYSNGLLACSLNVGGSTAGGDCPVTYAAYGDESIIVTYESGTTSATSGPEDEAILPPAPTLTQPANIDTAATSAAGATIGFALPTASTVTDDPTGPVNCTIPSGTLVAIGQVTDSCTVTDSYDNTTTQTFTITVEAPTTLPTFSGVPSDITVPPDTANGSTVMFTPPTAADAFGDQVPVQCSIGSNSLVPVGTVQEACTATDQWGNTKTAMFSITVQAPELTFNVSYETSGSVAYGCTTGCAQYGPNLPAALMIPMTFDGSDTYASLDLYPLVSGNVVDDPDPTGTITATISPAPWLTDYNGTIIPGSSCTMVSGDACGWYLNAAQQYTVTITFTSSDSAYQDATVTSEVTITG